MASRDPNRDWYSVSVDTLRTWGVVGVLALVGLGGWFGYRIWESSDLEQRSAEVIEEARLLGSRLQEDLRGSSGGEFEAELASAGESLARATTAFTAGDFAAALEEGRRSRALFQSIADASDRSYGQRGEAQFIAVQGRVEFRRGDGGEWEEAKSRVVLQTGDHVRTGGGGSAEIMFQDGTLYTARPDTQLIISRTRTAVGTPGEQTIQMEYGWVNLSTSQRGGKVATPTAEATVAGDSEATVTYDAGSRTGSFASYQGEMEVTSSAGERRTVATMERVVQQGDTLAEPEPLPPAPVLLGPGDKAELDLDRSEQLVLRWEPVEGAQSYHLQVARSYLFADTVIDDLRAKPSATLGLRGAGTFLWRVAALDGAEVRGAWSEPKMFRVASAGTRDGAGDRTPPLLELAEIKTYGSIFIVDGRTEPGSVVEVNGELVQVEADGSFKKTIQISQEGWNFVEVRARDAAGNEIVKTPRVFVEIL